MLAFVSTLHRSPQPQATPGRSSGARRAMDQAAASEALGSGAQSVLQHAKMDRSPLPAHRNGRSLPLQLDPKRSGERACRIAALSPQLVTVGAVSPPCPSATIPGQCKHQARAKLIGRRVWKFQSMPALSSVLCGSAAFLTSLDISHTSLLLSEQLAGAIASAVLLRELRLDGCGCANKSQARAYQREAMLTSKSPLPL